MSPPVLGFNNNVRHRGRVFHIQTEDSGVKTPRIVTHLFADGGRIIKTARREYSELVGRTDVQQLVRQMMKEQHKAMFSALRHGELDALLEASCGPLPLPPPERRAESMPVSAVPSQAPESTAAPRSVSLIGLANPNLHKITPSVPPPSKEAIDQAVRSLSPEETTRVTPKPAPVKEATVSAAPARKSRPPVNSISGRPRANAQASSRSIFGEGVISEKSLDEVILSYLAEDLDGQSE